MFIIGSVYFLPKYENHEEAGCWLFIIASILWLIVSLHDAAELSFFHRHLLIHPNGMRAFAIDLPPLSHYHHHQYTNPLFSLSYQSTVRLACVTLLVVLSSYWVVYSSFQPTSIQKHQSFTLVPYAS